MLNPGYQYHPSPVHRRDPRVKIIIITLFSLLILHGELLLLPVLAGLVAVVYVAAGLSCAAAFRVLRPALPFLVGLLVVYGLFTPGHPPLQPWHAWRFDPYGFLYGLVQVGRFALLLAAAAILTMTTTFADLAAGIEHLLRPLRCVGISSGNLALMVSLAMRFVPVVWEESTNIRDARIARGADPGPRSLTQKMLFWRGLAVPLVLNILRRSDHLVDAMEARGFHPGPRSHLRQLSLDAWDMVLLGLSITGFAILWFWF